MTITLSSVTLSIMAGTVLVSLLILLAAYKCANTWEAVGQCVCASYLVTFCLMLLFWTAFGHSDSLLVSLKGIFGTSLVVGALALLSPVAMVIYYEIDDARYENSQKLQ